MNEQLKKVTEDIAVELRSWLESDEVRETIEATQKAATKDTGSFEIVITTENIDRYQEVIQLDAWELDHYMKNPVVLWGHDHHTLPVGVTTSIENKDGKLVAKGKFATHEHAQVIRKLYDSGVLRAASVGFIEKEREGNIIKKAELIEWSIVSVPANPYCLSTIMKSGENINELVTKGFVFIEKEAEATTATEVSGVGEETSAPEEPVEATEATTEKKFDAKDIKTLVATLQGVAAALEDLADTDQEPEGNEAPVEETEEGKRYRKFSEDRKTLQQASTIIDDVLAEARQAIKARHK